MVFGGFVCATIAWAQGQGPTPPAIAPGNPASSYALSGIDSVNYFNGNLNIHIPLVGLGGRGQGAPSLILPIQRRWGVYPGLLLPTTVDEFEYHGYTLGYLTVETASASWYECASLAPASPILTWLLWHSPDGTETPLVDTLSNGAANPASTSGCGYTPQVRGTTFRSYDGSNLVFVATADVMDASSGPVAGTLHFPNGNRYTVDSDGNVSAGDRNGNQITYQFTASAGPTYTAVDSAGRTDTFQFTASAPGGPPFQPDAITYPGAQGTSRTVHVNYAMLNSLLSPGESLKTFKCLFPALNGTAGSNVDLLLVSSIVLPDSTSYSFLYNSYGDVTQITLPTGAVYRVHLAGGVRLRGGRELCHAKRGDRVERTQRDWNYLPEGSGAG